MNSIKRRFVDIARTPVQDLAEILNPDRNKVSGHRFLHQLSWNRISAAEPAAHGSAVRCPSDVLKTEVKLSACVTGNKRAHRPFGMYPAKRMRIIGTALAGAAAQEHVFSGTPAIVGSVPERSLRVGTGSSVIRDRIESLFLKSICTLYIV